MGRHANRKSCWMAAGMALCLIPAAPAQTADPGNGKVFLAFQVTPLVSAITGSDPDIPVSSGQLVEISWIKLRRVNSWSLKARAVLSGCGNFKASALTVRCVSAGPAPEGVRCGGPAALSETFQEIAGGGVAQPNKRYSVVAAYELRDSWQYHALNGCSINITYQASSQ